MQGLKGIEGMNDSHVVKGALQQAVNSTRDRIALDRQRVSSAVQVALEYIADNLLDPDLSVDRLLRVGKLTRTSRRRFRAELALSPKQYLIRCRMETAGWLLRNTEMEIWPIASALGYSRPRNFSRDYRHWSGQSPTEYRKAKGAAHPLPARDAGLSLRIWWQAVVLALTPERAQRLIARLEELFPASPTVLVEIRAGANTDRLAETVWRALRRQPPEEQRHLLRHSIRCASPALFHLLGKKTLEEGRDDRQRGIYVAELAIESLEANADAYGDALADLRALGWARLGNARRLAQDFVGAEEDFGRADKAWDVPRPNRDHGIEGEIYSLLGTLRIFQRRFGEAFTLLDRAIGLSRAFDRTLVLARSLIQRAKLYDFRGEHEHAAVDLREVLQLLEEQDHPDLLLIAISNLATSQVWAGEYAAALELLPLIKSLCESFGDALKHHQVYWLEGLAHQGVNRIESAKSLLQKARHGFIQLNETDHAAAVSLDLAIFYHEQGHVSEILGLTGEAIQFFDAYQIRPDALAARELLRGAVATNNVTGEILQEARVCRDAIRRDPLYRSD